MLANAKTSKLRIGLIIRVLLVMLMKTKNHFTEASFKAKISVKEDRTATDVNELSASVEVSFKQRFRLKGTEQRPTLVNRRQA